LTIIGSCVFVLHMQPVLKAVAPQALPFPVPERLAARRDLIRLLCDGIVMPHAARRARPKTRKIRL
jgi:hypothetical protein